MCCKAKIAAFLVLVVFAIPAAEAADEESDVPRAVKAYALQLEAECTLILVQLAIWAPHHQS